MIILRKHLFTLVALSFLGIYSLNISVGFAESEDSNSSEIQNGFLGTKGLIDKDMTKEPTNISSESLSVDNTKKIFTYFGNVEVTQGDMKLTTDKLEGTYSEGNDIQVLTAKSNVVITKGEKIKATSNKAVYDKNSETMTLTENPQIQQGESILSADVIKIFLKEDRSSAEGQVRVKLVKEKKTEKETTPAQG